MSRFFCYDHWDHEREGRRDFEHRGPYGYDREKYRDHWDACNEAYTHGFDEAAREERRAQDRRDAEQAAQARIERRREQHRREEEYAAALRELDGSVSVEGG